MRNLYLISTLLALCFLFPAQATDKPVIGILSIPSPVVDHPPGNYSYIPASYVKFLESAGARVVPIPYDASPENITFLLEQVNGVFFIGGGAAKTHKDPKTGEEGPSNLTRAAMHVLDHVLTANKNGEHFPLMTVCLGWEILLMALSNKFSDLLYTHYNDVNVKANVLLQPDSKHSKIWQNLPQELRDYIQTNNGLLYDHKAGILPDKFRSIRDINDVLKITSISYPVNGGPAFVASAEGRKYPIFASQFHPEKTSFEWKPKVDPPHSSESVQICQSMARTFVNEARKNNRAFKSSKLLYDSVIYNWNATANSETFVQVYTFRTVEQDHSAWPALFNKTITEDNTHSTLPSFKVAKVHVNGAVAVQAEILRREFLE